MMETLHEDWGADVHLCWDALDELIFFSRCINRIIATLFECGTLGRLHVLSMRIIVGLEAVPILVFGVERRPTCDICERQVIVHVS